MPVNLSTLITTIKTAGGIPTIQGNTWEWGGFDPNHTGYSTPTHSMLQVYWCVPPSVTRAVVEMWGGGGGGAPARCCAVGIPGNAGAYAKKTITVTPGSCYFICSGSTCCPYNSTTRGTNGPPICFCGSGATSAFYSNGGCGGREECNSFCCIPSTGNVRYNSDDAGNIVMTTAVGGDVMQCGLPGAIIRVAEPTGGALNDYSTIRRLLPTPPYVTNKCGGYLTACTCDNEHATASGPNYSAGFAAPPPFTSDLYCYGWLYFAGIGTSGGSAKGGNCYCGGNPTTSKIRITYY